MELSRIIKDVVDLEERIAQLYIETGRRATNREVAETLGLLAGDSLLHAKKLESVYGPFDKSQPGDSGVEEILSSLRDQIVELERSKDPLAVLQEGIKMEKRIGELYQGMSKALEAEEEFSALLDDAEGGEEEQVSSVLWKIGMEEKEHQRVLEEVYRLYS